MGATGSKISNNYTLKENIGENVFFSIYRAQHKNTLQSFTVFVNKSNVLNDQENLKYIQNAVKKLKTIRHPGIIKFIEAQVEQTEIFIVTEPIIPLASVLQVVPSDDACLGIYDVFKTLDFLHSNKLCHNALKLDSLYVKENGKWVIGGLEFLSSFAQVNPDLLKNILKFTPDSLCYPPEDSDRDLSSNTIQSRDYYLLGQTTIEIIARFLSPVYMQTNPLDVNWKELQSYLDQMISRNPNIRPGPRFILDKPFFKNNVLLDVVDSLFDIRSLSTDIKKRMFTQLPMKLRCITPSTVSRIILPLILKLDHFSEPGSDVIFTQLFNIQVERESNKKLSIIREEEQDPPLISLEAYEEHVIPFVKKALLCREYEPRIMCLRLINSYVKQLMEVDLLFLPKMIEELLLGLEDTELDIYIYSIVGIAAIVPFVIIYKQEQQNKLRKGKESLEIKEPPSITNNVNKTKSGPGSEPSLNDVTLLEHILIPHVLKVTVSDEFEISQKWIVLNELIQVWKALSIVSASHTQAARLCRSIIKCFHIVMRVLEPKYKIEFFCQKLIGNIEILDPHMMLWVPKVMELGIFFLKDDHKHVRIEIGQAMINTISLISIAMDKGPAVFKKRENQSLKNKLSIAYKSLLRSKQQFPKTGPRQTHVAHGNGVPKSPTIEVESVIPAITEYFKPKSLNQKIAVESNWEDSWNEDFDNVISSTNNDQETQGSIHSEEELPTRGLDLDPKIEFNFHDKDTSLEHSFASSKSVSTELKSIEIKKIAKTGSTSDIADIGMGQWDADLNAFLQDE